MELLRLRFPFQLFFVCSNVTHKFLVCSIFCSATHGSSAIDTSLIELNLKIILPTRGPSQRSLIPLKHNLYSLFNLITVMERVGCKMNEKI